MLVILLVPCVSAIQSDSFIKDQNKIDELNTKTNYGTYIIEERSWWDLFGWITDKEIKKVILKDNTDTCGDDCYAIKQINNLEEGSLIDDVRFYRIYDDGSQKLSNIRSYNFYIKTKEEEYSVDDYELKCINDVYNSKNDSWSQSCSNVIIGSHIEKEPLWVPYTLRETKPKGNYTIKLVGEKRPNWAYDWQVLIGDTSTWTEKWATWGSIGGGDDGEVILNSPADGATAYTNLQTFNATATVTGGSTLENISLWTNETGDWALRNTTVSGTINLTDAHGETQGSTLFESNTLKYGVNITANKDTNLTSVTR